MTDRRILSLNHLSWTLGIPQEVLADLAANAVRHYNPFSLKRNGKAPRRIDSPDQHLKNAQRQINRILLKPLIFPEYLHGGVTGRSPRTNALQHLGKRLVLRLDLKSFFPSITDRQIYSVWIEKLGFSCCVAQILTALTTYHQHLPQGAPTSTSLANLVLLDADKKMHTAASLAQCSYTRFVDDLVFSGDCPQALIEVAVRVLRTSGFRISREKLILMPADALQEVTGLSVNSRHRPSVPRRRRNQIKAAIHEMKDSPRDVKFGRKADSVRGRIAHLAQINQGAASSLLRSLGKIVSDEAAELN